MIPAHAELLADPFALWLAVDVGGVAALAACAALAPAVAAVEALADVPEFVAEEISDAIDMLPYERTVRVATDLSWTLEARS